MRVPSERVEITPNLPPFPGKLTGVTDGDELLLASLGYKQELRREFTPWELFGLAFGGIGVFPSIASVISFAVSNGGPFAVVWGWAISSPFLLAVGLAIAELGSAAPTSGGLYYWTHRFSSPRYKNVLSWVVGYSNAIGIVAGLAGLDWQFAEQVMAAASIGSDLSFAPTSAQTFGVYAATLVAHGLLCSVSTKYMARLQPIYVTLNILLCFAIIIGVPAATPREFKNSAKVVFTSSGIQNLSGWPDGFSLVLSFIVPVWTLGGYDAPVHISEDASNASFAVPWAITGATVVALIVGWGINIALAFNMGTDMEAIAGSEFGQPMAQILFNSFGKRGALAVWGVVIVIQFMIGVTLLTVSSRQIFAFSRDGGLPFSTLLRRVNKHTHTPIHAVWFSASIALLFGLLSFAGAAAVGAIFSLGVAGQYLAFLIPISARWLGKNDFKPGRFHLGVLSFPVATISALWMVFILVVFMFPTSPGPTAATMNYTVVVWGGVIILSLIYFYFPKYGGVYWFTGPVSTLEDSDSSQGDATIEEKGLVVGKVYQQELLVEVGGNRA
ncbi:APC amino acid permease [Gloeopeniophorella convolvens]|nr:APC amino acid permease [Gloeopeniophorella convolvens]